MMNESIMQWHSEPALSLEEVASIQRQARAAGISEVGFKTGDTVLEEGRLNDQLLIIVSGEVGLYKVDSNGAVAQVDQLGVGSFLGLLSFWTGNPSFSSVIALSAMTCLRLSQAQLDQLSSMGPRLNRLLVANLAHRYQRMVRLNLEVARLSRTLQSERNELKETLDELKSTRIRLIHRERLATMGQLLVGIAHEINNPGAALQKSVAGLAESLPSLLAQGKDGGEQEKIVRLFELGTTAEYPSSETTRERMLHLRKRYPALPRPLVRELASLEQKAFSLLEPTLASVGKKGVTTQALDRFLQAYDCGARLRTTRLATEQILSLIRSLKNYGRPQGGENELTDMVQCVQDTLIVLNNRLKHYTLQLELNPVPAVHCNPAEINQVITNLLVNACDATAEGGVIAIRSEAVDNTVRLTIEDSGKGLPAGSIEQIFEPNFTTKRAGAGFGLGLGLAISRDIVLQHGGSLKAENRATGGARFIVNLPI